MQSGTTYLAAAAATDQTTQAAAIAIEVPREGIVIGVDNSPPPIDNGKKSATEQPPETGHEKANNDFVGCFIETYEQKKYVRSSFFGKKITAPTENYSKSIDIVNDLIKPAVSAENLDETVTKFDALLDFFIAVPEKVALLEQGYLKP